MDEKQAKEFIKTATWVKAKTYEQTSPHEYTVIKAEHPLRNQAVQFMNYIFDNGVEEPYFGHPFIVCYIDDRHPPQMTFYSLLSSLTLVASNSKY